MLSLFFKYFILGCDDGNKITELSPHDWKFNQDGDGKNFDEGYEVHLPSNQP